MLSTSCVQAWGATAENKIEENLCLNMEGKNEACNLVVGLVGGDDESTKSEIHRIVMRYVVSAVTNRGKRHRGGG